MTTNSVRRRALVSALVASGLTALAVAGGGVAGPSHVLVAPKNESKPTISGTRRVGEAHGEPGNVERDAPDHLHLSVGALQLSDGQLHEPCELALDHAEQR